jgi:hypothetical protein
VGVSHTFPNNHNSLGSGQFVFPLFSHPKDILDDWPFGGGGGGGEGKLVHPHIPYLTTWTNGNLNTCNLTKATKPITTSSIESYSQHTTSILHKALGEHFLVYLEGTLYSRLFLKEERSYTYYSVRVRGILPLPHIQHYLLVEKKRKEKEGSYTYSLRLEGILPLLFLKSGKRILPLLFYL